MSIIKLNYIYLLQEREFVNLQQPIYKIGKTKQEHNKRFNNYPKGSLLIYQKLVHDCDSLERELIILFKKTFIQRTDIGTEYFEGDCELIIDYIDDLIIILILKTILKN